MASPLTTEVLVASIVILTITTIAVCSRLWVKVCGRSLGADDYLVTFSWSCLVVFSTLMIIISRVALGRHRDEVDVPEYEKFLRYTACISVMFSVGVTVAKMSFAVLYIRILPQRFLIVLNKCLVGFLICQAIEESFVVVFQCNPVQAEYSVDVDGKCLDLRVLWWFTFAFNFTTDMILFIQPIPLVWRLQMALAKRIGIIAMLSLGLLVCIISIIRIIHVTRIDIDEDDTYRFANPLIWSETELAALLLCSCIPSFSQIIHRVPFCSRILHLSSSKTTRRGTDKPDAIHLSRYTYGPRTEYRRRSVHLGTSSTIMAATRAADSTEEILGTKEGDNGTIRITHELHHEVEDNPNTQIKGRIPEQYDFLREESQ